MADQIIKFAVQGVASGIGLASESIKAHKDHKREKSQTRGEQHDNTPGPNNSYLDYHEKHLEESDEDQWALDDAQDELLPAYSVESAPTTPGSTEKPIKNVKILIHNFIQTHPIPNYSELPPAPRLPYPVVLPQRRPKDRSRGFIRAYAPVLMNAGIDQATFLDYLEIFDKASQASPWLNAINLAGLAFSFLPTGISMAISVAIAIAVKTAQEVQSRSRQNSFLDHLNVDFFRPRGLFCLVLTWNPESADTQNTVNLTSTINLALSAPGSTTQKLKHKFQASSGDTYGELSFPEIAPLIFPDLENLASQTDAQSLKMKEKLKKKGQFVDSYWDKRAQAKYAAENPNSVLASGPKPEFRSRYADPNHPASSGNLVSLVTGGHINPPTFRDRLNQRQQMGSGGFGGGRMGGGLGGIGGLAAARREMKGGGFRGRGQMAGYGYQQQQSYDGRGQMMGGFGSEPVKSMDEKNMSSTHNEYWTPQTNYSAGQAGRGGLVGGLGGFGGPAVLVKGVKKVIGKKVLYLMIVNLPSDEEMVIVTEQADAAEQQARSSS